MHVFFIVMAQLRAVFTAMTAVVAFKGNRLGLGLCENYWFILTEPSWFCLFGVTAGAKVQHWR